MIVTGFIVNYALQLNKFARPDQGENKKAGHASIQVFAMLFASREAFWMAWESCLASAGEKDAAFELGGPFLFLPD
jgi:hypothetical protein